MLDSYLDGKQPGTRPWRSEFVHDHAPDTDDVWAWIVIGMISGGVMLAIWLPMLKLMLQA